MPENRKKFKSPPKRFQPRDLTFLYEDHDILVVDKIAGLLTVSTESEKEKTAYFLLNNYVQKGNPKSRNRIFIVHRLDRDTSGVIVFAKNLEAKKYLQQEWPKFNKNYTAVVHGILEKKEGVLTSYLAENSVHKMYSTSDQKKGKLAKTGYKIVEESWHYSLLDIDLTTGRKNQIRVHLSDIGHAVVGDKVYGEKKKGFKRLGLHASSIKIKHPYTKEEMIFKSKTPFYFKELLNN